MYRLSKCEGGYKLAVDLPQLLGWVVSGDILRGHDVTLTRVNPAKALQRTKQASKGWATAVTATHHVKSA